MPEIVAKFIQNTVVAKTNNIVLKTNVSPVVLKCVVNNPIYRCQIEHRTLVAKLTGASLIYQTGSSVSLASYIAGENVSALKPVANINGKVYLASNDNSFLDKVIGISFTGGVTNGAVQVQVAGVMTDSSWNWEIGPIYIGPSGLTQVIPSPGYLQCIGHAISDKSILIQIDEALQII